MMIGQQQVRLNFLVPLALETLDKNLFAEGDFYEGDLLKAVLTIETDFLNENKDLYSILYNLIKNKRDEIAEMKFDTINIDNCCPYFSPDSFVF